MVCSLKFTRKLIEAQLVTRRIWASIAAWRTVRSAIKGWSITRQGTLALRITTPMFGFGAGIWFGGSN